MVCLRNRTVLPIALFAAGLLCIAAAVLSGEAEVSLFLIFPVFSGSSGLFLLGIALIVLSFITGFLLLMMGQIELASETAYPEPRGGVSGMEEARPRYGGVVLLGPVPIAFGSDKSIALTMLVIGIVLAIVAVVVLAFFLA